nr:ADP-ribose glycohydrolase MACROD1-like [Dermatophagoides farinae]
MINRMVIPLLSFKIGLNLVLTTLNQQSQRTMASFQSTKDKFLSMAINEKRTHYKCGENYVQLNQIPKWSEQSKSQTTSATMNVCNKYKPMAEMNDRLSLFNGDITTLEIDAIVNAANQQLAGGGGG